MQIIASVALVLAGLASPGSAPGQEGALSSEAAVLFQDAGSSPRLAPFARRERLVRVDRAALLRPAERLALELFDGRRVGARLERLEAAFGDGFVWVGGLEGVQGDALFSVVGDAVSASIRVDGELYSLQYAGNGVHRLIEADEGSAPLCGTGPIHTALGTRGGGAGAGSRVPPSLAPRAGGTGGARGNPDLDVMVVYTTQAKNGQGGTASMQSLINLAITETNQAYANSDITAELRLVHQAELVGYTENGNFNTELNRLTSKGDGHIDEVHTWRDQYGADLVAMLVNSTQYCGIAWLMTNPSPSFEKNAFSVTARTCATGYYSFGHEIGHNLGCAHDRQNASVGAYSYSFGYRTPNNAWRTVMAYAPGTRIKYFSNPNKTYGGYALGVAAPASNSAENWKTINNTSLIAKDWRSSEILLTVPVLLPGWPVTIEVSNATAGDLIYLAYSLAGGGPTPSPYGDLALTPPYVTLAPVTADSSGVAQFPSSVPPGTSGITVWFQALDFTSGDLSNGVSQTIL